MRSLPSLARAALFAAAAATGIVSSSLACADAPDAPSSSPRSVRMNQAVLRTAGHCTYSARLLGAYTRTAVGPAARAADGAVPARDALVNIDTRLECRGAPPAIVRRQLYFAATDEATVIARVEAAARAEHPASHGRVCTFAPVLHTDATGTTVEVVDVTWQCEPAPAAAPTAATPAPAPVPARHAARRHAHAAPPSLVARAR